MKRILYLGWDGSYVLSRHRLHKLWDASGQNHYLAPIAKGAKCIDIGDDGAIAFGNLKLKKFEVVRLEITARRVETTERK